MGLSNLSCCFSVRTLASNFPLAQVKNEFFILFSRKAYEMSLKTELALQKLYSPLLCLLFFAHSRTPFRFPLPSLFLSYSGF
jgi:hypothetical protein